MKRKGVLGLSFNNNRMKLKNAFPQNRKNV